ncbi:hypothetical protein FRX31_025117, partial [Thalictrum thalictroides]
MLSISGILQCSSLLSCILWSQDGSSCCFGGPTFGSLCIPISKSVDKAIDMVKKTPAYKNKLRALELERSGGITNKKKGHKQID